MKTDLTRPLTATMRENIVHGLTIHMALDEALTFTQKAMDRMIESTGGQNGRDFTEEENLVWTSSLKARHALTDAMNFVKALQGFGGAV